ncbi:phage major capsid protein [Paracandidimonas soli]|uniref:phage major capsid protein n=1 Tax=Paracandidimonas soli TaxID=1917182 RepID=UPI00361BB096
MKQRSKWAAMRADIKKLDDQIEREQELRDQEQRHVEDNADDIAGRAAAAGGELSEDEQRAQAFGAFLSGGMASLTSEQRALARQDEQRAQAAGVNDKGGYTVPPSFIAQVHELRGCLWRHCERGRVLVTDKGNAIEWPTMMGPPKKASWLGEH